MNRKSRTGRGLHRRLAGLAWAVALCLAACQPKPQPAPPPPPEPLKPLADAATADRWYRQWASEVDRVEDTAVRDALVSLFVPDGEGRRRPHYPPGYLVQVSLLDAASRPVDEPGTIDLVLVARPEQPQAAAVGAWSLDAQGVRARYRQGGRAMLPGYLLQLLPARPLPPGEYMLIVRWTRPDGQARITRNTVFQDYGDYAATRPSSR